MTTKVLKVTSEQRQGGVVRQAGEVLRSGGLVAFPTETVYGVAASAEDSRAVARLSRLKERGDGTPFTVHVGRRGEAARMLDHVPGVGRRLMDRAWPGPLTLIFEVAHPDSTPAAQGKDPGFVGRVYYSAAEGQSSTIGLRYPDCRIACGLINESGCVVIASSANRAGAAPPIDAAAVLDQLCGDIDLLLDCGPTQYRGPSTIARIHEHRAEIVRQGVLDERTVGRLATNNILLVCTGNTCRSPMAEGLLKFLLAQQLGCDLSELHDNGYRVTSAGTAATNGTPPAAEAVQAMKEKGIDIADHRSTALSVELIRQARVILTMTAGHSESITRSDQSAEQRCFLVGGERGIEDPIGGSLEVYRQCRDRIEAGLRAHLTEVVL